MTAPSTTPIFAYLRRSTTNKQEVSIENQADNIDLIIKDNGFNKDEIRFFEESRSAYDGIKLKNGAVIRKRTEFTKMLKAIDDAKGLCLWFEVFHLGSVNINFSKVVQSFRIEQMKQT